MLMFSRHHFIFKIFLISILTFSFSSNCLCASPGSSTHPLESLGYINKEDFSTTLDIHWSGGLPLVDVVINNKTYKFLFDTGAATTIIPTELITPLNIKTINTETFYDASGRKLANHIYQLPSMRVDDIEFLDFAVIAADFSNMFPMSCIGFDGILGYNFIRDLVVTLNLDRDTIILSDQLPDSTGFTEIEIKKLEKDLIPKVKLQFKFGQAWFGLDTGNNSGIELANPAIIPKLEYRGYRSRKTIGIFSATIGDTSTHEEEHTFLVNDFSIDNKLPIKSMPIHIKNDGMFLIGNKLLKKFVVIADFPSKKAYLKPLTNEEISAPFKETFGFKPFWSKKNKLFISALTDNTPAFNSGLEIGDIITSINNEDTSNFTDDEFCNLIRKLAGDEESYDKSRTLKITVTKSNGELLNTTLRK